MDESRFGLMTRQKRVLTKTGVKPLCPYQHKFDTTYVFGAFSPFNGDSCMLLLPQCNSDTFQLFLNEFSKQKPKEYKVLILDNGAFHHARSLMIPDNIHLVFLPPYSPEFNPAEKVWRLLKDQTAMKVYPTIENLIDSLQTIIQQTLTADTIKSVCGNPFYKITFQSIFNV
jgi:transposase